MRGAGQPPRTTAVASFPYPSCHSRTHPVIPAPILSFPHPILSFPYPSCHSRTLSCHSREGGNLAPCGRRAFIRTPHTQ